MIWRDGENSDRTMYGWAIFDKISQDWARPARFDKTWQQFDRIWIDMSTIYIALIAHTSGAIPFPIEEKISKINWRRAA